MSKQMNGTALYQAYAKARGGVFQSGTYRGPKSNYRWECSAGHTWTATGQVTVGDRFWCPQCEPWVGRPDGLGGAKPGRAHKPVRKAPSRKEKFSSHGLKREDIPGLKAKVVECLAKYPHGAQQGTLRRDVGLPEGSATPQLKSVSDGFRRKVLDAMVKDGQLVLKGTGRNTYYVLPQPDHDAGAKPSSGHPTKKQPAGKGKKNTGQGAPKVGDEAGQIDN